MPAWLTRVASLGRPLTGQRAAHQLGSLAQLGGEGVGPVHELPAGAGRQATTDAEGM